MITDDLKKVCDALRTSVDVIRSKDRHQEIADKRTACIYALAIKGIYTTTEIGNAVGRVHTCVRETFNRVNAWDSSRMFWDQRKLVEKALIALNLIEDGKQ